MAKPMPKPGWKLATTKGAYGKSYDYYGTPVAEGVTEIVWTGGDLPDDWYDEFVFRARLTDFPAGTAVYFPVVQECADGAVHRWIEIPEAGKSADDYEEPAPGVTISAAPAQIAGAGRRSRPPPRDRSDAPFRCLWLLAAIAVLLAAGAGTARGPRGRWSIRSPQDGASVAEPPTEIVVHFNEPVTPIVVRLLDQAGSEVPGITVEAANDTLTIRPAAALPPGGYYLSYRVTSLDAHAVGATLRFGVGVPAPGTVGQPAIVARHPGLGCRGRALAGLPHHAWRRGCGPVRAPGAPTRATGHGRPASRQPPGAARPGGMDAAARGGGTGSRRSPASGLGVASALGHRLRHLARPGFRDRDGRTCRHRRRPSGRQLGTRRRHPWRSPRASRSPGMRRPPSHGC